MTVRLNLGVHLWPRAGWINIDRYHHAPYVDLYCDVAALPFRDGIAHDIYAGHIIEHFPPEQAPALLREWWRVLAPGGRLGIVIPDVAKGRAWRDRGLVTDEWYQSIRNGQNGPGMCHYAEYTSTSLHDTITAALGCVCLTPIIIDLDKRLVSNIGWQSGWDVWKD